MTEAFFEGLMTTQGAHRTTASELRAALQYALLISPLVLLLTLRLHGVGIDRLDLILVNL